MPLHLHIDRLILNDIDLSPRERRVLQAAIEAELSQLLSAHMEPFQQDQNFSALAIAPITAPPNSTPAQLGQQIAQNIYQSIVPASSSQTQSR